MRIHFLGTGGFSAQRGDTSIAFEHDSGHVALIDCGEPCARRLRAKGPTLHSFPARVRDIFISHMHFDHVTGLPLALFQIARSKQELAGADGERVTDLFVPGCANPEVLRTLDILNMGGSSNAAIAADLELHSLAPGFTHRRNGLSVTAYSNAGDSGIESYAFLIEDERVRVLYGGDLPGTVEPIVPYLDGLDLLIAESSHVPAADTAQSLRGRSIEQVVFSHIGPRYEGAEQRILDEATPHLSTSHVQIAEDGLVLEI